MTSTNQLLKILEDYTALTLDTDLFYLEMPLGKSGLWIMDRQNPKAPTGYKEYDIFYRGKTKQSAVDNIEYLNDAIEYLTGCEINGKIFKLERLFEWDYLEKDSEGYYVFANTLRLL